MPIETSLPAIPAKRYFTIGEVAELCGLKPHVLRYWEQEFSQLRPMKRRGNRRYYQHHEVLMIRRIRELLYEKGFTISGARNRLQEMGQEKKNQVLAIPDNEAHVNDSNTLDDDCPVGSHFLPFNYPKMRRELLEIRNLLTTAIDDVEVKVIM